MCAFCGGRTASSSIEHCPPRAMFQDRLWPEGFEFPACQECNVGSGDHDLLIAILARMNPFEETGNQDGKLQGLIYAVNKQYPNLLSRMMPSATEARRANRKLGITPNFGQTHQETGVAKVTKELHKAVCTLARKLTKGVYYRNTGRIFLDEGCLLLNWFTNAELFRGDGYIVFDLLKEIGGNAPPIERSGKYLGDQFEFKLSLSPEQNVFIRTTGEEFSEFSCAITGVKEFEI